MAADQGEAVGLDDFIDPGKDPVPIQGVQRLIEAQQLGTPVVVNDLLAGGVEPHVAAPAEQIHKGSGILGKEGEDLGQQLILSPGVIQRRLDHTLTLHPGRYTETAAPRFPAGRIFRW